MRYVDMEERILGGNIIRLAEYKDLPEVAKIHKQMFSDHFLGKYSISTIQKYYQEFVLDCVFLVSEHNDKVTGFVLGGMSTDLNRAKSSFIAKYKAHYLIDTIVRPWVYKDALARIKTIYSLGKKASNNPNGESVRLLSIAVCRDAQGSGVASDLIRSFEENISPWTTYGLSVLSHNKRAQAFYLKNGFLIEKEVDDSIYLIKSNTGY